MSISPEKPEGKNWRLGELQKLPAYQALETIFGPENVALVGTVNKDGKGVEACVIAPEGLKAQAKNLEIINPRNCLFSDIPKSDFGGRIWSTLVSNLTIPEVEKHFIAVATRLNPDCQKNFDKDHSP